MTDSTDSDKHKEGAIVPGNDLVLWKRGDCLRWLKAGTVISEQADRIQELERDLAATQKACRITAENYKAALEQRDDANTEADTLARALLYSCGSEMPTEAEEGNRRHAIAIAERRVKG